MLLQRPDRVDRAIVKLNALTDADGAGAENKDLLLVGVAALGNERLRFVVLVVGGVEIRRLGGKFCGAGIDHLERGLRGLGQGVHARQTLDRFVEETEPLGIQVLFRRQLAVFQAHLNVGQMLQLVEEPPVDLGDVVNDVVRHAALEGLVDAERALGVLHMQMLDDFFRRQLLEIGQRHRVQAELGGGNGLHHGVLKVVADGHDLAGGHHLGAQRLVGVDELIKGPLRVLDHDVVQRRLEAGAGLAGDVVGDLIQRVADGDFGRHLGDGVAGGLGSQSGRTGHTGVDLDDRVVKAVGLQGKLAVAAALDAQLGDDVQRGGAEHLVLFIGQGLAGRDDDGVAGVDADGVKVLHVADRDDVALGVTHDLVLDFLPAGNALLYEDLMDRGQAQTVCGNFVQLLAVLADAAAGAAHREGGADDDGVADDLGKVQRVVQIFHNFRRDDGLVQLLHRVLEQLAVLGTVNRVGLAGQQADAAAVQKSAAGQLHRQVQAHLAAQVRQDGVGLLLLDDALDDLGGQRLNVNMIGNVGVGHDGGRVGVDEDGLDALGFQRTAGLRAGVVKLCRLTDDDGAGADDQYLFDTRVFRHC